MDFFKSKERRRAVLHSFMEIRGSLWHILKNKNSTLKIRGGNKIYKKKNKKLATYILVICLILPIVPSNSASAKSVKLSSKSIILYVGQTKTIKLKGVSGKANIKWKTSKKTVVSIAKKKGNAVTIKAKKKGSAVIMATYQKKQYKCKITVGVNTFEKNAISYLDQAASDCENVMDTIYNAWYFHVYKVDDYGSTSSILDAYSSYTGIPSATIISIMKEKYDTTSDFEIGIYIKSLYINLGIVHAYYEKEEIFNKIDSNLKKAKKSINKLGSNSTKKEKLKQYYNAVNNYYEFVYSPAGSFAQLGSKKESLSLKIQECKSDLSWD